MPTMCPLCAFCVPFVCRKGSKTGKKRKKQDEQKPQNAAKLLILLGLGLFGKVWEGVDGAPGRNRTGTAVRPRDFKSLVSTNFTTGASCHAVRRRVGSPKSWRREPESNRPTWICNPVHNRFAIAPKSLKNNEKLERETRLELATPTLARSCSTN